MRPDDVARLASIEDSAEQNRLFGKIGSPHDLDTCGRHEAKAFVRDLDVLLLLKKAELGGGTIELFNYDASNKTFRRHFQQNLCNAVGHSSGNPAEDNL